MPHLPISLRFHSGDLAEDLANDITRVQDLIASEIYDSCLKFPFTAANNQMTLKMSIRRHKVMAAYEDLISHLYSDDDSAVVTQDVAGVHREAV
jgi:long-subunit acyl-CoA synthetase (AMP-forming)